MSFVESLKTFVLNDLLLDMKSKEEQIFKLDINSVNKFVQRRFDPSSDSIDYNICDSYRCYIDALFKFLYYRDHNERQVFAYHLDRSYVNFAKYIANLNHIKILKTNDSATVFLNEIINDDVYGILIPSPDKNKIYNPLIDYIFYKDKVEEAFEYSDKVYIFYYPKDDLQYYDNKYYKYDDLKTDDFYEGFYEFYIQLAKNINKEILYFDEDKITKYYEKLNSTSLRGILRTPVDDISTITDINLEGLIFPISTFVYGGYVFPYYSIYININDVVFRSVPLLPILTGNISYESGDICFGSASKTIEGIYNTMRIMNTDSVFFEYTLWPGINLVKFINSLKLAFFKII